MPFTPRQTPVKPTVPLCETFRLNALHRVHALAAAVVLCTGLVHTGSAMALGLGRIVVQSALGEPLRAEIEVPEITAEEASSLRVGLASPAAFAAAGMQFNPALGGAQLTLERRPDGRSFLRLSSTRPVNEPFVDLMIEANWASGRIVRDYTLLIDPPKTRAAAPVAPVPAAAGSQPARPAASAGSAVPAPAPLPAAPAASRAPAAPVAPIAQAPAPAASPAAPAERPSQVRVRAGDTAGRIADANRPANVSLDQMLVAMLRANPRAFINDNVNRVKAGAVIDLPSESQASSVAPDEARQIISAQSRDFNEYRRRLAGQVPAAAVESAGREAAGRVQTEVQEPSAVAPAQDKLTLSKGAAPGAGGAEEKIVSERQAADAAARVAELARNVDELAKLNAPTTTPGAAAAPAEATSEAPGAAVTVPAAVPAPAETASPAPAASEPAAAAEPAPAPPAVAPAPPAEAEEGSLLDRLQENPLVLPAAGGLLALLAGLALYRLRQRKKTTGVDSSFLESRLQPDSFFGSSGGQRIDTADATASGSSMVYSPSQLDAAGDVDPVAEADVYLAYGRDLQAEEILKEAMRSSPTRVAIHSKLLEIYAKRRDAKAFEVVATEVYSLTQGLGPEWDQACALGRELDPDNPLYQPGGAPAEKLVALSAAVGGLTQPFGPSSLSADVPARNEDGGLDLDFSLDDAVPAPAEAARPDDVMSALDDLARTDELTKIPTVDIADLAMPDSRSMDFDLDFPSEPAPLQADSGRAGEPAPTEPPMFDLSDSLPDLDLDQPLDFSAPEVAAKDTPAPEAPADSGIGDLMSFDASDAALDLDDPASTPSEEDGLTEENPLETKLSLAEEFRAIGDLEGARSLAEEVLAEASGSLKTKANTFLSDLG